MTDRRVAIIRSSSLSRETLTGREDARGIARSMADRMYSDVHYRQRSNRRVSGDGSCVNLSELSAPSRFNRTAKDRPHQRTMATPRTSYLEQMAEPNAVAWSRLSADTAVAAQREILSYSAASTRPWSRSRGYNQYQTNDRPILQAGVHLTSTIPRL